MRSQQRPATIFNDTNLQKNMQLYSQQFRRFSRPELGRKRSFESQQTAIVKRRVEEAFAKDLETIQKPDLSPFKNKQDIIQRLSAYHIVQIPDIPTSDSIPQSSEIIADAVKTAERVERLLENERENSKLLMQKFASMLTHQ